MGYHYEECGLDNVYLTNGFTIHQTKYGEGVSIHDAEGLHNLIGRVIIEQACPMIGAELRFLRLEMELSQRSLAEIIGADEQKVRRWEKARTKSFNGSADLLLRALYNEHQNGDGGVREMVKRIAELDCKDRATIRLQEVNDHWMRAAA